MEGEKKRKKRKKHLPRVSHLSGNDKGDNELKLVVVHRSPGICFTARRPSDDGSAMSHHLKCGPLCINDIGKIPHHIREGERERERERE